VAGRRVLDVGCGDRRYEPYFAAASEYVGMDIPANPVADVAGVAEDLPFADDSFDVVLCIQVLEHVDDPAAVARELHRVCRPGGRVLASTHGTQVYHPSPNDHWRWTKTGLERLFEAAGAWRSVTVKPGAGTGATLAMLISIYVGILGDRPFTRRLAAAITHLLNTAGGALDRRSSRLREAGPGSLIANFHVTAER
jgi:SAM-dependent methyltransferase